MSRRSAEDRSLLPNAWMATALQAFLLHFVGPAASFRLIDSQ